MSLSLSKGSTLSLTKEDNSSLSKIRVDLSWNPNESLSSKSFDLDVFAVESDKENLRTSKDTNIAFFNQKKTTALTLSEDNRTGEGDGVDEFIKIDLEKISNDVQSVPVIVTIFEAKEKGQSFNMVDGAKVSIIDEETGKEIGFCNISNDSTQKDISLLVGVIQRKEDGKFEYKQVNGFYDRDISDWFEFIRS